jgi:RNA exonuclease 4
MALATCSKPGKVIAIDCEMVGVGRRRVSALARVSIVNVDGVVLLDEFVKPDQKVTDYRTSCSGVRQADLVNGASSSVGVSNLANDNVSAARSFQDVRADVLRLMKDKIVVGHAIHNDFRVRSFVVLVVTSPNNSISVL